jgi:nicotinate phosphoribosyltransferase
MQNAVLHHFPDAEVTIKFTNRTSDMLFNRPCFDWIKGRISRMSCIVIDYNVGDLLIRVRAIDPETPN